MMNDAEVPFGLANNLTGRMTLKAEKDLEKGSGNGRMDRKVE
jgi:hypothetical protein